MTAEEDEDDDICVGKFARPKDSKLVVPPKKSAPVGGGLLAQFLRGAIRRAKIELDEDELGDVVALFEMERIKSRGLRRHV